MTKGITERVEKLLAPAREAHRQGRPCPRRFKYTGYEQSVEEMKRKHAEWMRREGYAA